MGNILMQLFVVGVLYGIAGVVVLEGFIGIIWYLIKKRKEK